MDKYTSTTLDNINLGKIVYCEECGKKFGKNEIKYSELGDNKFYCAGCYFKEWLSSMIQFIR